VNLLLDTHAFLWAWADDPRLSARARRLIVDGRSVLWFSLASAWEIAVKRSLGKLELGVSVADLLGPHRARLGVGLLTIELSHVVRLESLPFHHRDPFDRLLICQALAEGLTVLSADKHLDAYGVRRVW
jgi:PIN domain nuclease of toxin-antitoxin system